MEEMVWMGISLFYLVMNFVVIRKVKDDKLLVLLFLFGGVFMSYQLFGMFIMFPYPSFQLIFLFMSLGFNIRSFFKE